VTLHVHAWGAAEARPILCLHGITAWGGRYHRLATLRLGDFRVLSPDLRGHGRSPAEPPWDFERHVADLVEVLDAHGVEQASVVGHSFGGRLGLELSARHPARVDALVLLDPAVWVPPHIALTRAEELYVERSFPTLEAAIEFRLTHNPHASRELVTEDTRAHLLLGTDGRYRPPWTRAAVIAGFGEMAKSPPLDVVRVRNLLVRGRESEVTPEAVADACRRSIASEVTVVPGGHNVLWDAFDETADAILRFLSEDSRAEG
jgi:lipase